MKQQFKYLSEKDIHNAIKHSCRKVLNEGFSAKHFVNQIDERIPYILKWKEQCDNGEREPIADGKFSISDQISINLKPFLKGNEYMQQKFIRNSKISIKYYYVPDGDYLQGNTMGMTNTRNASKLSSISIAIYFNRNASSRLIKETMLHEITHAIDKRIQEWKNSWFVGNGFKIYRHQYEQTEMLPICIRRLLYILWDTNEFQAWQSSLHYYGDDFNKLFESLMSSLEEANNINDKTVWTNLQMYLTQNNKIRGLGMVLNNRNKRDFSNTPLESVKSYFIKTSFKKLKKFIQKSKF